MTFPFEREGVGIPPLRSTEIRYARALRREVLDPFVELLNSRIAQAGRDYNAIRVAIRETRAETQFTDTADGLARAELRRVEAYHKRRFTTSMRRLLGVRFNPLSGDQVARELVERAIGQNVELITSIPENLKRDLLADITRLAREAPFDEQQLTQVLRETYGKQGYPLRRLSRDQTNKLVGQLTQARQQAAGIRDYIWRTSQDERVRDTHVAKNGLRFAWNSPPPDTGHPGNDIQCRCVALPVVQRTGLSGRAERAARRFNTSTLPGAPGTTG